MKEIKMKNSAHFTINNKETRGEGNCFFHAAFGSIWNEQIADREHLAHRQYLINAIKKGLDEFLVRSHTRKYLIQIAWELWIDRWRDEFDLERKKMEKIYNQNWVLINVINKYQEFSKSSSDAYYVVFLNNSGDEVKSILMQAMQKTIVDLTGYKSALITILNSGRHEFYEAKQRLKACNGWFDFVQSNRLAMLQNANKSIIGFFDGLSIKEQRCFCGLALDFYSISGVYINYHFSALMPIVFPEQFPNGFTLARQQADSVIYECYMLDEVYEYSNNETAHVYFNGINHYEQTQYYSSDKQLTYQCLSAQQEWLYAQLDNYYDTFLRRGSAKCLNEKGKEKLYTSVEEYQKKQAMNGKDRTYYRKLFIDYIVNLVEENKKYCKESPEKIRQNPQYYAIDAEDFLGQEGLALYMNALKEEQHSKNYRTAVFNQSLIVKSGQTLEKPPVLIIGGPSASGKSTAVNLVINDVVMKLSKKDDDNDGNCIVAIDGGICREVSQMRKLVIRAANILGYPGIKDLHKKSKVLGVVKDYVKEAALSNNRLGLVIPETYSKSFLFSRKSDEVEIKEFSEKKKLIFAQIQGKNYYDFKKTVNYLGNQRAWKIKNINMELLDLNNTKNLAESKAYEPTGFYMSTVGTKNLEKYYRKINKDRSILKIDIINDSSIKKEENELNLDISITLNLSEALKKEIEDTQVKERTREFTEAMFSGGRERSNTFCIFKQPSKLQKISESVDKVSENIDSEDNENIDERYEEGFVRINRTAYLW